MNKEKPHEFEILDCTIRDGGYLNNWDFDERMVKEVYRNVSRSGTDIIELGFRNKPDGKSGRWHCVEESFIDDLGKDISGIPIALMIDYKSYEPRLMVPASESKVSLYRVAAHKDKVFDAISLCEEIGKMGYKTSIQLMGIVSYTKKEIDAVIKPLKASSIDYIYFADSYGSLFPQDIKKYIDYLKPTDKKIGFHAHNGLQLAFANTLEAVNSGIDIVDGTIYGMGRGAGNLPLEVLITYLEKTLDNKKYNSMPILDLIDRYFIPLKKELGWGYNLSFMLSGICEVHPSYAKTLVDYHEYNMDDMTKILEVIKSLNPVGFDKNLMDKVINRGFSSSVADVGDEVDAREQIKKLCKKYPPQYKDRHKDRDFLILANGPTLKKHKTDIDSFIKKFNPVVMGANYLGGLFKPDYHAFSNKKRFINYIDDVDKTSRLLLSSSFSDKFISDYTDRDYERIVHLDKIAGNFAIKDGVINSNCRTVSILLIAVAIIMGAKRIFIAGMDGYKNKDDFLSNNVHFYKETQEADDFKMLMDKHNWNEALLNSINEYLHSQNKEGLHIITPTSHRYFYNSIYNWLKIEAGK